MTDKMDWTKPPKKGQVLLNGRYVDPSEIDGKLHRFIGTFRLPTIPARYSLSVCPFKMDSCRNVYATDCWREGHFDIPQYITITD